MSIQLQLSHLQLGLRGSATQLVKRCNGLLWLRVPFPMELHLNLSLSPAVTNQRAVQQQRLRVRLSWKPI